MRATVETLIGEALGRAIAAGDLAPCSMPETSVERPRDATHGDWASTVALKLAKELGKSPREIAQQIVAHLACDSSFERIEIAGPGFINLTFSNKAFTDIVRQAYELERNYARTQSGQGRTVNVEFISANPTGPMHVGHGRWAALGDALCRLLEHTGWQVVREFYINDAGVQMEVFGTSIWLRYAELCGREVVIPEAFYGGAYVSHIAQQIFDEEGESWLDCPNEDERLQHFRERGYDLMLKQMQQLCARIGVQFDLWFSERSLYHADAQGATAISRALGQLADAGYLYQADGATWFKTTALGDDKDRVLRKANGEYTYFAPDIAYHQLKFGRHAAGSEPNYLIDLWGADHHGYIPRMQAACTALGYEGRLTVVLGQLVNLFRGGEVVRMSKRTGEMVTFAELVEEVGADATKYLMLSRSSDQPLDFDIEVAKRQDASNPVYYVQYAHARICSVLRKAAQAGFEQAAYEQAELDVLVHESERSLMRFIGQLPDLVEQCARDLAPFKLTHYVEELASRFHRFYTDCVIVGEDSALTVARLYLSEATRRVLALTLSLLGVSAPERM